MGQAPLGDRADLVLEQEAEVCGQRLSNLGGHPRALGLTFGAVDQRGLGIGHQPHAVDEGQIEAGARFPGLCHDVPLVRAAGPEFGDELVERAAERLAVVVPLALLLIFVLLYGTFGAIGPALLIFLNVPFAAVGGIFALALRGMPFSISAGVGVIALFGVAVLNGVVLVSYIRMLEREEGLTPVVAASKAALVRMRPVLTTALVAALGFVPMAFSTGSGAEVQRPLATVVIGGLVTATLLTPFLLPAVYAWCVGEQEGTS